MNVPTTRAARPEPRRRWAWPALGALLIAAAVLADPPLPSVSQQALLDRQRANDSSLVVLDVRTAEEFVSGHVPGAVNIPHDQVAARLAQIPKDRDVVLYCRSGRRAVLAADVLAGAGYERLSHLEGDITAWVAEGRPVVKPADATACIAALADKTTLRPAACAPD